MDAFDRDIISHLERNGRMTNSDLAAKIGLSPTPTLKRVKALEGRGVIIGYRAVVDPDAVGRGFHVLVRVDLERSTADAINAFESAVMSIEEITAGFRLFGEPDYLLHVAVGDAQSYEDLYTSKLAALPGIRRAVSQIVMKEVKPATHLTGAPRTDQR